jgi:hypothetical protein
MTGGATQNIQSGTGWANPPVRTAAAQVTVGLRAVIYADYALLAGLTARSALHTRILMHLMAFSLVISRDIAMLLQRLRAL